MKKILSLALLLPIVLTACGAPAITKTEETKKIPFTVEVREFGTFPQSYTLEKTGRLVGSSTISLTSQGIGRVDQVLVKEGANVKKWQPLVRLKDTLANYDIRLGQANNALSSVRNQTATTELSLDRAIADTKLALERAESDLKSAESNAAVGLAKAERDAKNATLGMSTSDAELSLSSLEASLTKSKIDYQNLITANQQTLTNYGNSYQTSIGDIKKFYTKILFEGDRLYGITPKFQTENIVIRKYIGGGNTYQRPALEFAYFDLMKNGAEIELLASSPPAEWDLLPSLDRLSKYYKSARAYLDTAGIYLQNSTISSEFPQSALDGLIAANNGYKNESSALETGWVNFRNQAATFLANYRNNETAALAGLTVQEKTNETQRRGLATNEFESGNALTRARTAADQSTTVARTARDSAQIAYNNAVKNRGLTLSKLSLSESDAGLSLSQAREEFDKLVIRAPIDGSITRVLASVGQDVNAGALMIEMANKSPEMQIDVEASIVPLLAIGSEQSIVYDGARLKGTVVGVSQIANESLLYNVRMSLKDSPKLLGQVATVELVIASQYQVLSTDLVRVISDRKGELSTLSGSTIVPVEVDLGRIAGSKVEITNKLDSKTPIILTNVSNFDPKRAELIIKK